MTTSQRTAWMAAGALALAEVGQKLIPLGAVLPPALAKWLPVVVVLAGGGVTLFNQSAHPGHVSFPKKKAKALGVAPEQTEGK